LFGEYTGDPRLNPEEVMEWKWMALDDIARSMETEPESYTVWFRIAFPKVREYLEKDQR